MKTICPHTFSGVGIKKYWPQEVAWNKLEKGPVRDYETARAFFISSTCSSGEENFKRKVCKKMNFVFVIVFEKKMFE
jgi:hypothetical protein